MRFVFELQPYKPLKTTAMRNKILITVEGGTVQNVTTNFDAEIVIVDYDSQGDDPVIVSDILEPDTIVPEGELFSKTLFEGKLHNDVAEAKRKLKDLNF